MALKDELKTLLGSTFVLYVKTHGFHFNVEGSDFPQYHGLFKDFYEKIYETVDVIGEYIRTLDSYTPGALTRYQELSIIEEQLQIPRAELMMSELLADFESMRDLSLKIFEVAAGEGQQGISNYMAELQDLYSKQAWMVRSILKKSRA